MCALIIRDSEYNSAPKMRGRYLYFSRQPFVDT